MLREYKLLDRLLIVFIWVCMCHDGCLMYVVNVVYVVNLGRNVVSEAGSVEPRQPLRHQNMRAVFDIKLRQRIERREEKTANESEPGQSRAAF